MYGIPPRRSSAAALAVWLLAPVTAAAQAQPQASAPPAKALTLDALYHPDKKVDFTAGGRATPIWLDDASYILQPMRPGARRGAYGARVETMGRS